MPTAGSAALRCALLQGPLARCYAGVGVVRDSDPAAEYEETLAKAKALVAALREPPP